MLYYVLIGLSLVLVGVSGLQFSYMFYLDRLHLERKKYIHELEHKCRDLTRKLSETEDRIAEIEAQYPEIVKENEWAEVIEES